MELEVVEGDVGVVFVYGEVEVSEGRGYGSSHGQSKDLLEDVDAEGEVGVVESEYDDVEEGVEIDGDVGGEVGGSGDGWERFVFGFWY